MTISMKKVLFVIDTLTCGGAEKSLISLLPLLDYSKIHVDLMLDERGGFFEQYVPKEVHVMNIPHSHTLLFCFGQIFFSILLRVLGKRHGAEVRWIALNRVYEDLEREYDVAIAYQHSPMHIFFLLAPSPQHNTLGIPAAP